MNDPYMLNATKYWKSLTISVFRAHSKIYDGAFFAKIVNGNVVNYFSKTSTVDVQLDSKYVSAEI